MGDATPTAAFSDPPARRTHARVIVALGLAIAVAVHLPALRALLLHDDYAQRAMADGTLAPARGPLDLYDYIDDTDRAALLARGALPWWTSPSLVLRFFRPLSSVLAWIDIRAFGYNPFWPHVHSLLWWTLAVAAVHCLLARVLTPLPALLGTIAYALAPCHAPPLLWLANRDVLVSTAFGASSMVLYCRFREHQTVARGLLTTLAFAATMAAGEYSLCVAGYIFAFEIVRRREGVATRATGLLPFALPMAVYVAAVLAFHYGTAGTGFYRSPLSDFGAYVLGAPRRMAVLFASGWLCVDDVSWSTASEPALLLLVLGTIALGAIPVALVMRNLDGTNRAHAIWMLAGSVAALAPVLATEPSVRVLGVAMLGISAWVGLIVDRVWTCRERGRLPAQAAATWIVALILAFAHFVWAPIQTVRATDLAIKAEAEFSQRLAWLRAHIGRDKSTVIVFRADSPPAIYWTPFMLRDAAPARWRVLSFGAGLMSAIRRTPNTLELVAQDHPLFPMGPEDFFRNVGELRDGSVVQVPGMRVSVLKLDRDQMATRLLFEFDQGLDDPPMQFISERQTGFEEVAPPPVGFGVRLVP